MKKIVMTAVIPAIHGCNLRCAGCIIGQRGEAAETVLTAEDYMRFVRDVLDMPEVASFSLQGHEPLLPDAWPLGKELLRIATEARTPEGVGKRTLCVTNGTNLACFADEIVHVTDNLSVSIDSHDPAIHDSSRGKVGAWHATVDGIQAVRDQFWDETEVFQEYLGVVSILYPGKVDRLAQMPELLESIGVTRWTVSPLISVSKDGYHGNAQPIRDSILELADKASEHGVELFLGDDLRQLEHVEDLYQVLSVAAVDGEHVVVRLSPDGSLSVGKEILRAAQVSRKWDRIESPRQFLKRVVAERCPS